MKRLLLILIFVILILSVSAIRINEVEMNPKDDCYDCTEWAELYSETKINLSGYWIENSKSQIINLSGSGENYIKIDFGKRFLTNSGDKLVLKKEGQVIDKTKIFKDDKNNDKTWQFCEKEWIFDEQTKGKENKCGDEKENDEEDNDESEEKEEDDSEEERGQEFTEATGKIIENPESQDEEVKPIVLNPQNIKTGIDSEEESENYAVYSFIAFSVLLAFLFWVKRKKYRNEFT